MSFGAIATHPSTFTVDAADGEAVTAGAFLRAWREDDKAADPFFDVHAAWKAASVADEAAQDRMNELEEAATEKYGDGALLVRVQVGTTQSSGKARFVYSDDQIDALIADRIKRFQDLASSGGFVSTDKGLVPLAEVIERQRAQGERPRAARSR